MATARIRIGRLGSRADTEATVQAFTGPPRDGQDMSLSAGSNLSTIEGRLGEFWSVTAEGGRISVVTGESPDAAASFGWLVGDGATVAFGVQIDGEKIAVKAL